MSYADLMERQRRNQSHELTRRHLLTVLQQAGQRPRRYASLFEMICHAAQAGTKQKHTG